jgi:acetyl-CoA acetyltransferase
VEQVYVAGVGMTPFSTFRERPLEDLAMDALAAALADAGCERRDLDCAFYTGATNSYLQGQTFIPGQIVLSKIGVEGIPIFNIENACTSGTSGFHLAVQTLRAGEHETALVIASEKMNIEDKTRMFSLFDGGWDVTNGEQNLARLLEPSKDFEVPEGHESSRPYSVFMKLYAAICREHMQLYGTTQRQIAAVCAKNHTHSVHNPLAQFRQPYTIDEVLQAPPITYPLTLPMCAPISDGAAALVLCNQRGLTRLKGRQNRAIRVLSSQVRSASSRGFEQRELHCERLAANKAYEQAGIGPEDIDVAEVHDATAMAEIIHVENLGFVAPGDGGPAAERGEFSLGGRLPVNPSGGLESKGHPIGATGLAQIHELVTQLRGEAGNRQVENARHAVHENSGGLVGIEEGAVAINVFASQ